MIQPPLPDPALGSVQRWTVPLPPSFNTRWKRRYGGGIYVDPTVDAWETAAKVALLEQGWQPLEPGRYTVAIRWWFSNDRRTDGDKRCSTLLDFLTRLTGTDDSLCWSCMWEKGVDKHQPRAEFGIWPYVAT